MNINPDVPKTVVNQKVQIGRPILVFKQKIIRKIVNAATDEPGEIRFFAPLLNFKSDLLKIRLADNVFICKPSIEETKVIEQDTALSPLRHSWDFIVRAVLPFSGNDSLDLDVQSALHTCCRALRLLKPGTIGLGSQYMVYSPPFTFLTTGGRSRNPTYLDTIGEYLLKVDELERLLNIYNEINSLDIRKLRWLHLAIIRFEFSYDIALLYSPLDLMIGLEALYIADDKELSYKLAMRAAYLLAESAERRNDIFSIIMAAYGVRSRLVHGVEIKDKIKLRPGVFVSIHELTYHIREILRESILIFLYLATSASHKNLTGSLLDENILTQGTALTPLKPKGSLPSGD